MIKIQPDELNLRPATEIQAKGLGSRTPVEILMGTNLGAKTLTMIMPMADFWHRSAVANRDELTGKFGQTDGEDVDDDQIAQRPLNEPHARGLAVFFVKALLNAVKLEIERNHGSVPGELSRLIYEIGAQDYFGMQPITANIRNLKFEDVQVGEIQGHYVVYLADSHVLWVIDGQHRRKAMEYLFKFIEDILNTREYPKRPPLYSNGAGQPVPRAELEIWNEAYKLARTELTVTIEAHLGLNPIQERQLFHDLNNLTKKVDTNLSLKFDRSNPVNLYIKQQLEAEDGVLHAEVSDKDVKDWQEHKGEIARKDLAAVCSILFLNKTNPKGAVQSVVDERQKIADRFWHAVNSIEGFGEDGAKLKTVAAQPVVLKALAKLAFDFAFGREKEPEGNLDKLLNGIPSIDFSHKNPMWQYYQLTDKERRKYNLESLGNYLPEQTDAEGNPVNRDIGSFEGGYMRFGTRHNDIFPIIGDMIRWKLRLPNRHNGDCEDK